MGNRYLPVQYVAGVSSESGRHEEVDEGVDCSGRLCKKSSNKPVFGRNCLDKSFILQVLNCSLRLIIDNIITIINILAITIMTMVE